MFNIYICIHSKNKNTGPEEKSLFQYNNISALELTGTCKLSLSERGGGARKQNTPPKNYQLPLQSKL